MTAHGAGYTVRTYGKLRRHGMHTKPTNSLSGTRLWMVLLPTAFYFFASACGGEGTAATPSPSVVDRSPTVAHPTTGPSPSFETSVPPTDTVTIRTAEHTDLGTIIVDGRGATLYLFTEDDRNQSSCADRCAETWPPLLTPGEPSADEGVTSGALGLITRADGSKQVTYNGWPLYHFAGDEKAGDAEGQSSGGVWFVVSVFGGPKQNRAAVKTSENSELGIILTDASGRTLYLFTVDERDKSNCLGGCAVAWPPMLTIGDPTAGPDIAGERLTSITRSDGSQQVTYNGWPLYYYAPDRGPGDARGQNSGSLWYAISTYGGPIQTNAVVQTSDRPGLGVILTEASGRTVYLFTMDEPNQSRCIGGCALAWPPLLTVGSPTPKEGVLKDRLDGIRREDGYLQVTYNGWPLYYFSPDEMPGDTLGQGVGDVWFVVSPAGKAVTIIPPTPEAMDHSPETLPPAAPPTAVPPTAVVVAEPSATSLAPRTALQVIATLENYTASQFFPATVIVIKDVPVNLLMTRLHREHVNKFTIEPFVLGRPFALPGAVANIEFTPDKSGKFKMRNVGHFFEADFIVADSVADAKNLVAQRGIQEFSLIHDFESGSTSPSRIIIQKDIPVRAYNTSLNGDGRVSIEPFYVSQEVNVRQGKISTFEFIPDATGEFAIRDGNEAVIGILVVE